MTIFPPLPRPNPLPLLPPLSLTTPLAVLAIPEPVSSSSPSDPRIAARVEDFFEGGGGIIAADTERDGSGAVGGM